LNTEKCPDVSLRHPDGCNLEQFEASGHRRESGWKVLVIRMDDALTDECPDGYNGLELHCLEFYTESS
jgi:hypothetical protein